MTVALATPSTSLGNLYADGDLYDLIIKTPYQEAEIDFYSALAEGMNTSILELGCGTGRLSVPLAARGHAVTGIDCADSMLEAARTKAKAAGTQVKLMLADFRSFDVGAQFGLIIFPFNSISHLYSLDDLMGCFSSVRSHLAADGLFVIDINNPTPDQMGNDPDARVWLRSWMAASGEKIDAYEASSYDLATQVHERTLFLQHADQEAQLNFRTRLYFPQEIDNLLRCAGFKIVRKCGSFGTEAFTSASQQQLIICSKRGDGGQRHSE